MKIVKRRPTPGQVDKFTSEKGVRKSVAPQNYGFSREGLAKTMKGLKLSGYKIPERLKP